MKALLIISHGSRRDESNREVFTLGEKVAKAAGKEIDIVACAFLSLSKPTIEEAFNDLIDRGAKEIFAFPFFLAAGNHVAEDIPEIVENERAKYPEVEIKMTSHLGGVKGIEKVIVDEINRT